MQFIKNILILTISAMPFAACANLQVNCSNVWGELDRIYGPNMDSTIHGVPKIEWNQDHLDEYHRQASNCFIAHEKVDTIRNSALRELEKTVNRYRPEVNILMRRSETEKNKKSQQDTAQENNELKNNNNSSTSQKNSSSVLHESKILYEQEIPKKEDKNNILELQELNYQWQRLGRNLEIYLITDPLKWDRNMIKNAKIHQEKGAKLINSIKSFNDKDVEKYITNKASIERNIKTVKNKLIQRIVADADFKEKLEQGDLTPNNITQQRLNSYGVNNCPALDKANIPKEYVDSMILLEYKHPLSTTFYICALAEKKSILVFLNKNKIKITNKDNSNIIIDVRFIDSSQSGKIISPISYTDLSGKNNKIQSDEDNFRLHETLIRTIFY